MDEPLEDLYFNWLCAKVVSDTDMIDWMVLLKTFHSTEFIPLLAGDHNRAEEGLALRFEFVAELSLLDVPEEWASIECSIFEMMLAFSKRAAWQTSTSTKEWFWKLVENLKLNEFQRIQTSEIYRIEEVLYQLVWRLYDESGYGGLFPLRESEYDQRTVEIWYQFCEYVRENDLV